MIAHVDLPISPTQNGLYAAEVYFGWKILAWRDGEWWHESFTGRWTASVPLQFIGPFPALIRKEGQKGAETPKQVFDL